MICLLFLDKRMTLNVPSALEKLVMAGLSENKNAINFFDDVNHKARMLIKVINISHSIHKHSKHPRKDKQDRNVEVRSKDEKKFISNKL